MQAQLYGMKTQQGVLFRGLLVIKKKIGVNVSFFFQDRLQRLSRFGSGDITCRFPYGMVPTALLLCWKQYSCCCCCCCCRMTIFTKRTGGKAYRPTHVRPPEVVGPIREIKTRECAKAMQRSQSGPGAAAWLRTRPVDTQRVIPAQEFLWDRGALGGDVPRLWCNGRQHATCTFVPSRRRAGKPTPAVRWSTQPPAS